MAGKKLEGAVPEKLFVPVIKEEKALVTWINGNGISVFLSKESSALLPKDNKLLINKEQYAGAPTLMHEASHAWLISTHPGYDNKYVHGEKEPLELRGEAHRYRLLAKMTNNVAMLEETLSKMPLNCARMNRAFGKPETHEIIHHPDIDIMNRDMPVAKSWFGNIVDETATLGLPAKKGHPMQNYQEFFASFSTTMAFDGQNFFKMLGAVKKLSTDKDFGSASIVVLDLLKEALWDAKQMLSEMKSFASTKKIPMQWLKNFDANLAKLEHYLIQKEEKKLETTH